MNIFKKIVKNKDRIVGIRVNGYYYHVEYVEVDTVGDFRYVSTYQIDDNDCYIGYDFYTDDLEGKEVKLYELKEL